VGAGTLARMIDVIKGTWIYKLQAGENRKETPEFISSRIKTVVYREEHSVPSILVILKDGSQRLDHPAEFNMKELEALTHWAENLRNSTNPG
jgi:hypothetical protein